ncbi:hypothetical protein BU24DRAFT_414162 [Aaosphaeria arxii CBS 175.79]|uniref:Uncharacterized protein n=1 Tax=Aaosphaeria arxii CBS 175.79 TaxID=1450172 RepID=A0A6A5XCH1_9PLEO|nr:uncharacterized protein BU24DRAFT_414162 [Aaosphaeria arxii CBS 175.79]KAF2010591.1 hypothetical protein BU24DRAFT_414162 [Aaosphaeria arxii CBS 175.79]
MASSTTMSVCESNAATPASKPLRDQKVPGKSIIGNYFAQNPEARQQQQPAPPSPPTSLSSNVSLREAQMIKDWASIPPPPRECDRIAYCSWTHFTSDSSLHNPHASMRASNICDRGVTVGQHKPYSHERNPLGDEEAIAKANHIRGQKLQEMNRARQGRYSQCSWSGSRTSAEVSSCSTQSDGNTSALSSLVESQPIGYFKKQPIRNVSTSSLLTLSMRSTPATSVGEHSNLDSARQTSFASIASQLRKMEISPSMLPDAFDSDSDSDAEKDDAKKNKKSLNLKQKSQEKEWERTLKEARKGKAKQQDEEEIGDFLDDLKKRQRSIEQQ